MSDPKDNQDDQDPDYATPGPSNEAHQKLYEETARTNVARKITAIVDKEFSKEIDTKEKEIIQIEGRLHKALKTLHFLRYVIITDFYNRKQCQAVQPTGESKQSRIHPAIKQMIGKAPRLGENLFEDRAIASLSGEASLNSEKTKISTLTNDKVASSSEIDKRLGNIDDLSNDDSATLKKLKNAKRRQNDSFVDANDDGPPRKIPRYVPPKSGIPEPQVPSRGARHKVRKRIVVGNISKWIPPDWREDAASHKWTMYVRGSKENADIGDFVGKIRFFLHPSYRPNDVVEVTSPPFHLSRRGWGEFPLRVQLHFKNPLNKPMDIIHYLKLDRTYTGLQTLGSETVVDVWIKISTESSSTCDSRQSDDNNEKKTTDISRNNRTLIDLTEAIKQEPLDSDKVSNDEATSFDAPVCRENIKDETEENDEISSHVYLEHDYANIPDEDTVILLENDKNITISHSPTRETTNDENNITSNLSSTKGSTVTTSNCPKISTPTFIFEEIVETSANVETSTDTQASRIFNGNCAIAREFTTIANNGEPEITIEACDSSRQESDYIVDSSSNNIQTSQNVETMASNLEYSSSKLQPLRIAIPAAFEALRRSTKMPNKQKKQILVMRDEKLIPVNSMNLNENTNRDIGPVMSTVVSDVSTINLSKNISQQRTSVSLLRQPTIGTSKTMMFTLSPTNSLLLSSSNNIPALKIVEPSSLGTQRLYLVEKKMPHRRNVGILSKTKNKPKETGNAEHWLDNYKLVTKPRITLGKDRIGTTSKKDNYEEILRSIDDARITDVSALVRFVIRRVPLVTERATDPEYRNLHPYASSSEKEFLDSNVGKQRALEWYRAKRVKSFLKKKGIPEELQWTVKEIMIWSRLHGHTPIRSLPNVAVRSRNRGEKSSNKNYSGEKSETSPCTFTEPSGLLEFLRTAKEAKAEAGMDKKLDDEIDIIDVENINGTNDVRIDERFEDNTERKTIISLGIPEKIVVLQSYVCDTTRQIGVKLEPEEIVPGVMHCAPARMMVRAVQCLLEDLLRSSLAKAWGRSIDGGCPDTITLEDVRGAILNREEFDVFTNEGLGSHHCPDD